MFFFSPYWVGKEWSNYFCQVNVSRIRHQWEVEFLFGGTNQLCTMQSIIFDVKSFCPWIRLHAHYHWH